MYADLLPEEVTLPAMEHPFQLGDQCGAAVGMVDVR